MANNGGESLGKLAWLRFRKDTLAMSGALVIMFSALVAILGPVIAPDNTPFANRQMIELAASSPGSHFIFLRSCEQAPIDISMLDKIVSGTPDPCVYKVLHSYSVFGDSLQVEEYTGDTPNNGIVSKYALQELGVSEQNLGHVIIERTFILGTDRFGRDLLSRMIIGSRISLSVGLIAVSLSLFIGILLGSMAGFFRGRIDDVIMWFVTVVWSIPLLLLVIAITLAMGKGIWQVFIAVGMAMWVEVARIVRGQILSTREKEYVEAARALGYGSFRIITKHILPNIMGPIIVISAANFAAAILIEAGLSFLGIGAQPPMPSWGSMIKDHYGYIIMDKAFLAIVPGAAILLLVLAFTLVGNGVRDALDVKRN